MLKAYEIVYKTYWNEKCIYHRYGGLSIEKEVPENAEIEINWESLTDFYNKLCFSGFHVNFHGKKGRSVSIENNSFLGYKIIAREWKDKNLYLVWKRHFKEVTPPIKEILEYYDGDVAIQYLKERGLMLNASTSDFTV